jgi:hypothetical protein
VRRSGHRAESPIARLNLGVRGNDLEQVGGDHVLRLDPLPERLELGLVVAV